MRLKLTRKSAILLATVFAIALIVCAVVGSTLAWLTAVPEIKVNTLVPATVNCEVKENFNSQTKKNVAIENTSNMDAYIRVALVPAWKDANGNIVNVPALLEDCTITWGDLVQDWVKGGDGFYYCKNPVAANAATPLLINSCIVKNTTHPDLQFELQVVATAIQALPTNVVKNVWGVTLSGTTIMSKGA